MTLSRSLKWLAGIVLLPPLLAVLFIAIFGWNWLRAPIERMVLEKTGRVLAIQGDLRVKFGWPWPHIQSGAVTFANPAWAREKQMVTSDSVDISIDLPQLLRQNIVIPEVRLERPVVFLEQASGGRKNWLLDLNQQDEDARVRIDRLAIDSGKLGYDDVALKTSIRADLSTANAKPGDAGGAGAAQGGGITFTAQGNYKGLPVKARGNGGPVLALRDENTPYALKVDATAGATRVQADGTITSLLKFTAMDMRLALKGDNLEQLFPLLGIALPATPAYTTEGHLLHEANNWRYEKFSGRIGQSDIAGSLQVLTGGPRLLLTADLNSNLLDIADLGPMIGSRPGSLAQATRAAAQAAAPATAASRPAATGTAAPVAKAAASTAPAQGRVLPDLPFNADRWNSMDAEVKLNAKTIRRAKELPLENLVTQLSLHDSVLKLDPLNFGLAGGQLNGAITLDGGKSPIQAVAKIRVRKVLLAKLFPTVELNQTSIGQINGEFDLSGSGNSVGRMLATANGKVGLVVAGGEISRLMMEKAGLHIWEILQLNLGGDQQIKLRCAVADFDVKGGSMRTDALVFDTAVTTIIGTGTIDLAQEKLDLTLNQKTKNTSPLALRSPIYVHGSFARPEVDVDKAQVAARALGAIALGVVNPFLALIPLIDAGPGKDSDCGQLVREARTLPGPEPKNKGAAK